ncbi:MAG: PD40 domain-containing protein [Chloroflexi bacterium]|nr:PD40 domain-containing protein [Chloroflexota bacterium]MBI3338507.1 PD40 domain-containing protein [Chloroflexota bacterium]
MKDNRMKDAFENIARRGIPENINLWPKIEARLNERKSIMQTLRARPVLTIVIIVLALSLLTGVAYAIGRLTGFIPGIGFVETSALRVLAEPVAVSRDGITVSIEQVVVDSERTVIVYKTEGLMIEAANSKGEGGGPFGSEHFLRLPDGTVLKEEPDAGYSGTPEPLINQVQTEGGWPNYVWRLVYPSVPLDVNELTLVIPVLQNMPLGAAPENWEVTFRLKPAPPDMTFAPITVLPTVNASITETGEAAPPALSNVAAFNGFTFQLDNVVELADGFVFTGNLSWDDSAFPTGKGIIAEAVIPTMTDASGQQIPVEEVRLDAPYSEYKTSWSYRTNRKSFSGPLTLSVSSIKTNIAAPPADFEIDFGSNPQVGQTAQVNRDFVVEGRTIRLRSVSLVPVPDSCQGIVVDFNFSADAPGISANVSDVVPSEPMVCAGGGGGGGGGPVDPTVFTTGVTYKDMPTGIRRFSIEFWLPYEISGPWQVQWNPPLSSEPTPTPEPGACLTLEKWNQLAGRNDALPAGVGGRIVTTINEGGLLPAIYVSGPDGANLQKIGTGAWPSLSNNGMQLVYSAADGLRVVDLSSGKSSAFGVDGYRILWSPDDTRMMYTTTFGLYVINADGSGLRQINTGPAQVISPTGWVDDQTIVYAVMGGDGFTFTSYNLQSGETKSLFTIQNKAGYGAISPDGKWIVFADRVVGEANWGIFISRLDGSERKMVVEPQVSTAFASVWGPDGQWLIVNTRDMNDKNIPVLVNPFTCEAFSLNQVNGTAEGWSR